MYLKNLLKFLFLENEADKFMPIYLKVYCFF